VGEEYLKTGVSAVEEGKPGECKEGGEQSPQNQTHMRVQT
jgi:hypothetical protein